MKTAPSGVSLTHNILSNGYTIDTKNSEIAIEVSYPYDFTRRFRCLIFEKMKSSENIFDFGHDLFSGGAKILST